MSAVQRYVDLLTQSYALMQEDSFACAPESRLEYLGEYIFNFTTYDGDISAELAARALEVCAAISDGSTFDYIKDPERYRWYIALCNTPFFAERINWGTSIRGAWWDHKEHELASSGLFQNGEQVIAPLRFSRDEWTAFVEALVAFAALEAAA